MPSRDYPDAMGNQPLNRRERKKLRTRDAIEDAAWRLFVDQGYDETTVEDIADAVDISPRTFFRYFESKEAVLFGDWRAMLDQVTGYILARPPDESPIVCMREVALAVASAMEAEGPKTLQRKQLAGAACKVGDYEREVMQPAMEEAVAGAIAQRLGVDPGDLKTKVYASVSLAALITAKHHWVAIGGSESLYALVQQAFDLLLGSEE